MTIDKEKDKQKVKSAVADILSMEKRLPEDFDPQKELKEERADKELV